MPLRRALLPVAAAGALLLTACAPVETAVPAPAPDGEALEAEADPDAIVNVASTREPESLSPLPLDDAGATQALGANVYEALTRVSESGAVEPSLASEFAHSDDGLVHTLTIRDGVTFHSGAELTADDVVASIARAADPSSGSAAAGSLANIASVEAVDDRTVRVALSQPSVSLPYRLASVWIAPAPEDVGATAPAPDADAVGTGPYALADWTRGSSLALERNDDYWGDAPANGGIVFRFFDDDETMISALMTGVVDIVADDVAPEAVASVADIGRIATAAGDSMAVVALDFGDADVVFDDVRVRQAVSAAIDDDALLAEARPDGGLVVGAAATPADPWFEDLSGLDPFDPARARELLDEAGQAAGLAFPLEVPDDPRLETVAQTIRQQLSEVGVSVELRVAADDAPGGAPALVRIDGPRALADDGIAVRDAQAAEWLAQSEMTATTAEQVELMRLAARRMAEVASSEWLFSPPSGTLAAESVTGYAVHRPSGAFSAARIEKSG